MNEFDSPTLQKFQQEHQLHQMQNSLLHSIDYCQVVNMEEPMVDLHIQLQKIDDDKIRLGIKLIRYYYYCNGGQENMVVQPNWILTSNKTRSMGSPNLTYEI